MPNYSELSSFLSDCVANSILNSEVLVALLPGGQPHQVERSLWDYKACLPQLAPLASEMDRSEFKAKLSDIMKDAVSFYNACGGYLLFGVADSGPSRIIGCSEELNVGDFNARLEGVTGHNIECLYANIAHSIQEKSVKFGLLYIPKRPELTDPAVFRKAAPKYANGKQAYKVNDVYVRIRDQCRPATSDAAAWKFLYGPRNVGSGTGKEAALLAPPIRATMPPRDPDMIKFIGRDSYLQELREWLTDRRSSTRLLTGIGGLGKTSIAYKFCEELVDTRAAEIEQLVWLTAKPRTFSALNGRFVEASRTDFFDVASLYRAILTALGSYPDYDEDDLTTSDILELIVEALSIYACLLVIDDVDSLTPDDQREVVHSLSIATSRTVRDGVKPSRVLFTSRIDQGVSPASAIKVEGFATDELSVYVAGIAAAFGVILPPELDLVELSQATSGSPLFASSVVRLVKLGASLNEALQRWRGEDGVEVRRFAFQRELQTLPASAARLLYAIFLLGDTTALELSQVLEVTKPALSVGLSNLQSFHLVSTTLHSKSEATIVAPDDIVLTRDILYEHLGSAAKDVELACARARVRSESTIRRVASGIGQVAALWRINDNNQALHEAEKLNSEFPSHADVTCLLASALIKPGIARWAEADAKFATASKQGCNRPELFEGWIIAKRQTEDWQGLLKLASQTVSTTRGEDRALQAYIDAVDNLIKIARIRHDRARRIELSDSAISHIDRRLKGSTTHFTEREWFWKKKLDFARLLMDETEAENRRPGDQIRIFDSMLTLVDRGIHVSEFIQRGTSALAKWWKEVESRDYIDDGARNRLTRALSRLESLERALAREAKNDIALHIQHLRLDLVHRAANLFA